MESRTMSDIKKILIASAAIIIVLVLSFVAGQRDALSRLVLPQEERVDTLYICDTITQYEPILEERVVLQKVLVYVRDTMWIHDTLYVYMDREQVVWQDSLSRVYASGILPQIDSVQHFIEEKVVTRELTQVVKKPCKWGLGVHAGYGIQLGEPIRMCPYIGIGISYNILTW